MKKFFIAFILTFSIVYIGCADRQENILQPIDNNPTISEISGSISDTLFQNKSPYYVTGNIKIDSLSTLIIEPGVRLLFYDSTYLEVYGKLQAIGKSSSPIIFTSYNKKWRGIRVINSSKPVSFRFAIIENVFIMQVILSGYAVE